MDLTLFISFFQALKLADVAHSLNFELNLPRRLPALYLVSIGILWYLFSDLAAGIFVAVTA